MAHDHHHDYEIEELEKEESWRMFRILGEFVDGFDKLSDIKPSVSIYGSARVSAEAPLYATAEEIAYQLGQEGFSIVTGGGPGLMEAANKGAMRAGVPSVGLNIMLPMEQSPNKYTTKSLSFSHFFTRKVMLVKYASAFVIMPGGLGTMDELTEILTLMQTDKITPFPIILYGTEFWDGFLNWLRHMVMERGYISQLDCDLLRVTDSTEEVVEIISKWYQKHKLTGKKALNNTQE